MTDVIDLAVTYGGYTSLDRAYLQQLLAGLSLDQQLRVITPPPSVINAYFAEHYQKNSPEVALDYLLELSRVFDLFQTTPDFTEQKPFVRLNLSGRSFGLCFENTQGLIRVFPEDSSPVADLILFDMAELFPERVVYREGDKVYLTKQVFDEKDAEETTSEDMLLVTRHRLADGTVKLAGYNREDLLETAQAYPGRRFFGYSQRQSLIYLMASQPNQEKN